MILYHIVTSGNNKIAINIVMRVMTVPIVLVGRNRVSAVNRVSASRRIGTKTLMDLCSANTLMNSNNEKQNQIKQQTNVYIWRFPKIWVMWVKQQ